MSAASDAQSWVLGAAGAASLVVAAGRVVAYRERAEATRAYLATALGAIGIALLLNVAPCGRLIDILLGATNISIILSQVAAFVCAWAGTELVMASTSRVGNGPRRARFVVLVLIAVLLLVAFLAGPHQAEQPVVTFFVATSQDPGWRGYWLLYAALSALPSMYLGATSVRHAGEATPWLRTGLVLVGAGAALCVVFDGLLVVGVVLTPSLALGVAQMATAGVGCALVAVGVALPHLPDLISRHRLRPMWSSLTAMYPEVRAQRRPHLRRMVTEVQDTVVIARSRDELASPLVCALAALPAHSADAFEETVADLVAVSRRHLSPEWDADLWSAQAVTSR